MSERHLVHPYIANSAPDARNKMMEYIGIKDVEEIYAEIPESLRFRDKMKLPDPIMSECDLKKHVESILRKNVTCEDNISFLGGGCWQHYVPAVCDEVINRSEFLTAYCGANYSDLGKYQARFEFYSMLGEMLNMDVVSEPIYDWGVAAGMALRMASRITGRYQVLIAGNISPERLSVIRTLCQPAGMKNSIEMVLVGYDGRTGLMDLGDLKNKLSEKTAAIYIENPQFLGNIETRGREIFEMAHANGAIGVAGVDPISLGILMPPADYGADIVCGDLQPLGVHMSYGGGTSGFIAFHDDIRYAEECPLALYTIGETVKGEYVFAEFNAERTSYGMRDQGKDWVGTASGLYSIAAAVYMALMGPQGMKEIGDTIVQRSHYAAKMLARIPGVEIYSRDSFFKEFVVNFDRTNKSVQEINEALLKYKIFGGHDLSIDFPELGQAALYCVTEIHSKNDIDCLATAMKEVLAR